MRQTPIPLPFFAKLKSQEYSSSWIRNCKASEGRYYLITNFRNLFPLWYEFIMWKCNSSMFLLRKRNKFIRSQRQGYKLSLSPRKGALSVERVDYKDGNKIN